MEKAVSVVCAEFDFFTAIALYGGSSGEFLTLISNNIKHRVYFISEEAKGFSVCAPALGSKVQKITIYYVAQVTYTINTNSITFFMETVEPEQTTRAIKAWDCYLLISFTQFMSDRYF